MFGLFGDSSAEKEAKRARAEEDARQRRIREGSASVNRIFDGGMAPSGRVASGAAFDPKKTYYTSSGSVWKPPAAMAPAPAAPAAPGTAPARGRPSGMGALFGGRPDTPTSPSTPPTDGRGDFFRQVTAPPDPWAQALEGGLFTGRKNVRGMDDEFFADRRQSYIDFARPQLDDSFSDAKEQNIFGLARSGLLSSSVAGEKNADLSREYQINLQDIVDKARGYETDARRAKEGARSSVLSLLQTTGDAAGASNAAMNQMQTLAQTPAYSPLGQLFGQFTGGLAQQAALERAEAAGSTMARPRYNTGLFSPRPSSVRTT